MKLFGLLLVLALPVSAEEIQVKKMTQDGELERSHVLRTNLAERVVLDCQSFIQGLRIGEYEDASTYMLDEESCQGLQDRIKASLKKKKWHCIFVEDEISSDRTCL